MSFNNGMFVLIIIAFLLSLWAQFRVKGTFRRWSEVPNQNGMTGYDAARQMLDANGLHDVPIEPVRGTLSDHYDQSIGLYVYQNQYITKTQSQLFR